MDDDALGLVLGKLDGVRQQGGYWMARCPAHQDREASLSVARGEEQPVVFKCHAGCDRDAILDALGLSLADVSAPRAEQPGRDEWTPRGPAVAVYDYTAEDGALLFQVLRTADKQFPQRHPDPATKSGWRWNLAGVRRVPYRLPAVVRAVAEGRTVWIAEGEKDVHSLERAGAIATTSPGGAGKWREEYSRHFAGADVVIIPDDDEPGRKHAAAVAGFLRAVAKSVVIGAVAAGKDATDHLAAGHSLAALAHGSNGSGPPGRAPDGRTLLDDVYAFLGRFVAYPSEAARVAHTLWIAHAHLMDAWESTPRIAFLSPEPGSGKTRALEVSELLVPHAVEAINTTPAYLFRKVADPDGLPTILYDEIDTVFGPRTAKDNEEIRGLLNAGHRRGAVAGRCVIKGKNIETEELPAYCAVALAGLGDLPETLLSRAVVVRMRRRSPDEQVEPFRRRVHKGDGHRLRDQLATWGAAMVTALSDSWPAMPEGIADRNADVWEALLAVADAAGGEWPDRGRVAAVALVAAARAAPPSLGVRLLADLREVFGDEAAMSTEAILAGLRAMEEAPWADLKGKPLDARGLAARLRQYGIRSQNVRIGDSVPKGYQRTDLHDPWARYLPALSSDGAFMGSDLDRAQASDSALDTPGKESATSATSATSAPCASCGESLDPVLAAAGDTTHPNCWPPGTLGAAATPGGTP